MALINCPACSTGVSDLAPACPHCGHPLKAIVTEQTSKKWKGAMLFGIFATLGGCVGTMATCGNRDVGATGTCILVMFAGVVTFIGARVGAWWNHR
jgi:hypothetical protein